MGGRERADEAITDKSLTYNSGLRLSHSGDVPALWGLCGRLDGEIVKIVGVAWFAHEDEMGKAGGYLPVPCSRMLLNSVNYTSKDCAQVVHWPEGVLRRDGRFGCAVIVRVSFGWVHRFGNMVGRQKEWLA